jgi:hypothetical protein
MKAPFLSAEFFNIIVTRYYISVNYNTAKPCFIS